ncbi:MAG TPA: SCO family protein [Citreicella sp.]|jgi:protein SCO1/2|nr:SCO family protein [Citreicella sp.]|tara:strand:+ start:1295 stop:1921 length:627 start_codon:yes stop_codon:yes gene_type:complete
MKIATLVALVASGALLALMGGIWVSTQMTGPGDEFAECRMGTVAGGVETIGGPFTLVNAAGETVTDAEVITEPALVYFGYTFCPDVCPLDTVRNAEATDILEEQGHSVTPVMISIDPARDTPEVMGEYSEAIHPRMVGLTGSEEQVQAATQAYRAYAKKNDSGDDYYLVDHSAFTYLVLPEQGFVEFFRRELTADEVAERSACFLDKL